jgi:bifunctional non-homologous end joining protein LigD
LACYVSAYCIFNPTRTAPVALGPVLPITYEIKHEMTTPLHSITLYKTEGSADKVYGLTITPAPEQDNLYQVHYMNGPRGGTMRTGLKTTSPVDLATARKVFDQVAKSKMKDGYTEAQSGQTYTQSPDAGRVSGYKPQLPSELPKDGAQAQALVDQLLTDDAWGAQEKMDGENRLTIITANDVQGTNRDGLFVDIPGNWVRDFKALGPCVLAGEQIGEQYHVFDILELRGRSLANESFTVRYAALCGLLLAHPSIPGIELVELKTGRSAKLAHLKAIELAEGEGVVFKLRSAPFEAGKNTNSYKKKNWEAMTCFVLGQNKQRSVSVGATDPNTGEMVTLGNVTIPANQSLPDAGSLLEVRYLYRYERGSLFQPTSLGPRRDIRTETVTTAQITRVKRKVDAMELSDAL